MGDLYHSRGGNNEQPCTAGCGWWGVERQGIKQSRKTKTWGKLSRVELAVRTTGSQSLLHSSCRAEHGPKAAALSEEGLH